MPVTVYDSNGRVVQAGPRYAPNGVVCQVRRTSNQALAAATHTALLADTKLFDPFGWFDTATGRFTPKVPGYYRVGGGVLFNSLPANSLAILTAAKNGAIYSRLGEAADTVIRDTAISGTSIMYLNGSTDYASLFGYSGSAATMYGDTAGTNYSWFEAELISSSVGVAPEPMWKIGEIGSSYAAAWLDYSDPVWSPRFFKDPHGIVHMSGLVQRQSGSAYAYVSNILTMPAGYRPGRVTMFDCSNSGPGMTRLDMSTAGVLAAALTISGGSNTAATAGNYINLQNVRYRAEA